MATGEQNQLGLSSEVFSESARYFFQNLNNLQAKEWNGFIISRYVQRLKICFVSHYIQYEYTFKLVDRVGGASQLRPTRFDYISSQIIPQ